MRYYDTVYGICLAISSLCACDEIIYFLPPIRRHSLVFFFANTLNKYFSALSINNGEPREPRVDNFIRQEHDRRVRNHLGKVHSHTTIQSLPPLLLSD